MNYIPVINTNSPQGRASLRTLEESKFLSLDLETTGLEFTKDKIICMTICDGKNVYFFSSNNDLLPGIHLEKLFSNSSTTWFLHNALFDLSFLGFQGLFLSGQIYDTLGLDRTRNNSYSGYSLAECCERVGLKKSGDIFDYMNEHKLYDSDTLPGKKIKKKQYLFEKVPFDILFNYACNDAKITYELGQILLRKAKELDVWLGLNLNLSGKFLNLIQTESKIIPVLLKTKLGGIQLDTNFVQDALDNEVLQANDAAKEFETLTGEPFKASNKLFEKVFASEIEEWFYTDKGNPSFSGYRIDHFRSAPAQAVRKYRKAKSNSDFYLSFMHYRDSGGVIHPNLNPFGTRTGRFSSSEPNFQNLPKEDDSEEQKTYFDVRRAIVPRDGYKLYSLDYKAIEFRILVNYANETRVAERIKEGVDPHQATANYMGCSRKAAKTVNFALLYGMGNQGLADKLGISLEKARDLRKKYFATFPRIEEFIGRVQRIASLREYVVNPYGRILRIDNPNKAYTATNHLIQSTAADTIKTAMVSVGELLKNKKSRLLLQVHDELLFEIHHSEENLVPEIKALMEAPYPHKLLPLECLVTRSDKSWADMEEINLQVCGAV